tara:strand:- start:1169 stop:1891 length:723 start_codon:yes stop_codon:yes gene_type:complete
MGLHRVVPVAPADLASITLGGIPLAQHDTTALRAIALNHGFPAASCKDDAALRVLIAALLAAGVAEQLDAQASASAAATSCPALPIRWSELRAEAANLLLLTVQREKRITAIAADAINLLNKDAVIESYQTFGNRWTIAESDRDIAEEFEPEQSESAQLLGDIGRALDEPLPMKPWYASKMVLAILSVAVLFVAVHVALLVRVLTKVHYTDQRVLLLPVIGFSCSALIGGLAIGINKLSG